MTKPDYVYVTYIETTPEQVWQAIVDPAMAREYWVGGAGCARVNVSEDWQPGSRWEHQRDDEGKQVDIAGTVLESTPTSRLVIGWARPGEVDDPSKVSRVTFDIHPEGDGLVKLTVTHDDVARDEKMFAGISGGWPRVLSNMKTFLETGSAFVRVAAAH